MRSLWRMIALRWLGGRGSAALTEDSGLLDLLMTAEGERAQPAVHVTRQREVSQDAAISRREPGAADAEPAAAETERNDSAG